MVDEIAMARFKEIEDEINRYESFLILSHISPEADAIGSQLGLSRALRRMGKKTVVVNQDGVPRSLAFLKGSAGIVSPAKATSLIDDSFLTIVVDCGELDRVGNKALNLTENLPLINIDHHPDNPGYGDLNYVEDTAATAQIIYRLIQYMGIDIDPPLATSLYSGIVADTSSFRNENVRAETMTVSAELLDQGADARDVVINLYERERFPKIKLLGEVLTEASFDPPVVWASITQELLEQTNTTMEDTEGIVNQLRTTEGAKLAILFKELHSNKVKISLRAKKEFDVGEIARSFGGGGHKQAAGCVVKGTMGQVVEKTMNRVRKKFDE